MNPIKFTWFDCENDVNTGIDKTLFRIIEVKSDNRGTRTK